MRGREAASALSGRWAQGRETSGAIIDLLGVASIDRLPALMRPSSELMACPLFLSAYPSIFGVFSNDTYHVLRRYWYIWPFEHARVRLLRKGSDEDDYMNASYVQPLGTTKRYIATQGPLAATFTDFWT